MIQSRKKKKRKKQRGRERGTGLPYLLLAPLASDRCKFHLH